MSKSRQRADYVQQHINNSLPYIRHMQQLTVDASHVFISACVKDTPLAHTCLFTGFSPLIRHGISSIVIMPLHSVPAQAC